MEVIIIFYSFYKFINLSIQTIYFRRNLHHIYHVLFYVRRIFYQIETKNSLNKKAAELYETNFDLFMKNVKQCIDDCNQKIYDNPPINSDDPHAIRFTKLSEESFTQIKQSMINLVNSNTDDSIILTTNDKNNNNQRDTSSSLQMD